MDFTINGYPYTFTVHGTKDRGNQGGEPYVRRNPLRGYAVVNGRSQPVLMNRNFTPQGNVSERVSMQHPNGRWYFRDDKQLREIALSSTKEQPLVVTAV